MRVLLVDDHTLVREGFALLLKAVDPSLTVQHASSLASALAFLASDELPNLVLLDLGLPGLSGLQALERVCQHEPTSPVVVLSGIDDPATVRACIESGAMGFIPKSADSTTLFRALRVVIDGGVYLPDLVPDLPVGATGDVGRDVLLQRLTPRQRELLPLLIQGKTNKVIARELGITELTVKSHGAAMLDALGVANRTEAVYAVRHLALSELNAKGPSS